MKLITARSSFAPSRISKTSEVKEQGFSSSVLLIRLGAKLERAVINFMLDLHTEEQGYTEILPPFMVGGGAMPPQDSCLSSKMICFLPAKDMFLIPTAEVPVTNLRIQRDHVNGMRCLFIIWLPALQVQPHSKAP